MRQRRSAITSCSCAWVAPPEMWRSMHGGCAISNPGAMLSSDRGRLTRAPVAGAIVLAPGLEILGAVGVVLGTRREPDGPARAGRQHRGRNRGGRRSRP